MHWTEHPNHFLQNKDEYAANNALVFDRMDFGGVFFNLMFHRYDKLADHVLNLDNTYKSKEEIVEVLQERVKPFDRDNFKPV